MKYIPIILPCAGKGTRSGLNSPKSLFVFDGKTILESIIDKCIIASDKLDLTPHFYIVIRDFTNEFTEVLNSIPSKFKFTFVFQPASNGTADAVYRGVTEITTQSEPSSICALVWGDCIGFTPDTLVSTISAASRYDVVVPGFYSEDCYTVFELNNEKMISTCSETKGNNIQITGYTDIGIFSFNPGMLMPHLENEITCASQNNRETSFINALSSASSQLDCFFLDDAAPLEKKGFNSPGDLN